MLAAGCPQQAQNIWDSELGKQPGIQHSTALLLLPEMGIYGRIPSFLEKTEGLGSTKSTPRNTWVALPQAVIQEYLKFPKMPSQVAA